MRRSDFLNLGGFDPIFDPVYFEDADLAMRLRSLGLFTYYCGRAVVYHHTEATWRREWTPDERDRIISANHANLLKRRGDFLKRRVHEDSEPDCLASLKWESEAASGAALV
jgi:GT2 family glycosyltransferase